jgi:hypothetical protein
VIKAGEQLIDTEMFYSLELGSQLQPLILDSAENELSNKRSRLVNKPSKFESKGSFVK